MPLEIKGSILLGCRGFVEERFGPARWTQVQEALAPEPRAVMSAKIFPGNWYAFPILLEVMRTAKRILAPRQPFFYRDMGRFSADFAVNRFYRFLMTFTSTERVLRRAPGIWPSFYRPGRMVVLEATSNSGRLRLEDFPHDSSEFCERIMGWMERIVELTGGRNCQMEHPVCITRGDPYCEYQGDWI